LIVLPGVGEERGVEVVEVGMTLFTIKIQTHPKLPEFVHIQVLAHPASSSNVPSNDSECFMPSSHGIIWCDPVLFSISFEIGHVLQEEARCARRPRDAQILRVFLST
jgi:hypothetical protein